MLQRINTLLSRITLSCFGIDFKVRAEHDNEFENGRVFIQIRYSTFCIKDGCVAEYGGRKFYLSQYMTDDEIVKTVYVAFEACVKHEVMEGFAVDGIVLFNPHINFEELLKISHKEITRN